MGEWLAMIRKNDIKPADVEKIDIGTNHNHAPPLCITIAPPRDSRASSAWSLHQHPGSRAQGRIERISGRGGARPDVQAMIPRVNFHVDPEAEAAGFDKMTSILEVI